MNRNIEQWEKCDPEAMATLQSTAAVMYALKDAKHDILFLNVKLEQLQKRNAELEKVATDLCDAIENKTDLPQSKWALKCGFLINRTRDVLEAKDSE